MNILKNRIYDRLTCAILFAFLLSNSFLYFLNANAVPENNPFDDSDQSICYFLQELDILWIDGSDNQSTLIRNEVNESAQHFLDNTDLLTNLQVTLTKTTWKVTTPDIELIIRK